jgi:arginase
MDQMRIDVVTVPYRYDHYLDGSGRGARTLIEEGLLARLESVGVTVGAVRESSLAESERSDGSTAVRIGRLGSHTAGHVAAGLRESGAVAVISGDDTAMVGVVSGIQQVHGAGARIGLVWFDAHGDFNTPDTSYSGILAGMPVAILAGLAGPLWRGAAGLAAPIPTDRIVIAGVRMLDEREQSLLQSTDVRVVQARDLASGALFSQAIARLQHECDVICVHVDLDVLDPALVPSSATPEPDGLSIPLLTRLVSDVLATGKVNVVSVAGLNPGGGKRGETSVESAMNVIVEVLGALKAGSNADA